MKSSIYIGCGPGAFARAFPRLILISSNLSTLTANVEPFLASDLSSLAAISPIKVEDVLPAKIGADPFLRIWCLLLSFFQLATPCAIFQKYGGLTEFCTDFLWTLGITLGCCSSF